MGKMKIAVSWRYFSSSLLPVVAVPAFTAVTPCCLKLFYFIGGSQGSGMTLAGLMAIVGGAICGPLWPFAWCATTLLIRLTISKIIATGASFFFLPTLIGGLYASGRFAWLYACLLSLAWLMFALKSGLLVALPFLVMWSLPVIFFMKNCWRTNLFVKYLGATLVSHSIGTMLWAYSVPMGEGAWRLVSIISPFERLAMAAGLFILHSAIMNLNRKLVPWRISMLGRNFSSPRVLQSCRLFMTCVLFPSKVS